MSFIMKLTCFRLRNDDTVLIKCGTYSWRLPRDLLRAESRYLHARLEPPIKILTCEFSGSQVFELFLQWLFSRTYQEYDGYALKLDVNSTHANSTLEQVDENFGDAMVWTMKASMLAWSLGLYLQSPRFQNYAMGRLLFAFSRETPQVRIDTDWLELFYYTPCHGRILWNFLVDMVVRNWGDGAVVDHTDTRWVEIMATHHPFRQKFLKGVAIALEKRREQPVRLADYLVPED
jgi:hypothetical protein